MNERLGFLNDKASKLPLLPGVYIMKDESENIIYVGKAKALKNRVSSYFKRIDNHNIKTFKLVENIYDFDFIVTDSELDALVLEASLIKRHDPKYNIKLKDDTGYNYIKISGGDFPKISYTLQTSDTNATYIGPYTSNYTIKETVSEVNRIFMLPSCTKKFPQEFGKDRPCLNYHIKRCLGVCQGNISKDDYNNTIKNAIEYIKGGSKESINRLTEEMEAAAEKLDFERAAKLRDQINAITKSEKGQQIQTSKVTDFDIIGMAQNMELASIAVIMYRKGRLTDKENFFIGDEYDNSQMRSDFISQYYSEKDECPKEIYIDYELTDKEILEEYLSRKFAHKISIITPKKGWGLTQVTLAKSNANEYLSVKVGRTVKDMNTLSDLAKLLGLKKLPQYIESYDISNLGDDSKVGGMVVFRNGKPFKAGYRKFTIKSTLGQDDYAAMREVIQRRFQRYLDGDEGFAMLPDLILLDGGKGHVNTVSGVLCELGIDIPLYGLVKDDKHRTRAIASSGDELEIAANKNLFAFLTSIQDEVHRFAITFQRATHKKKTYELELTKVPGIGEKKVIALMKHFKTKQGLKEAEIEELKAVAGVNMETAEMLYSFIRENF